MPDHRFLFALKLSSPPRYEAMLGHLARHVLEHVGYAPPTIEEILDEFRAALERAEAEGARECDVEFRAADGQLSIVVSYAHGRAWRFARPLPD